MADSTLPSTDCDDTDASINPNASEVCDGVDNDCDSDIDSADSDVDASTGNTYYLDADNDLYGDLRIPFWPILPLVMSRMMMIVMTLTTTLNPLTLMVMALAVVQMIVMKVMRRHSGLAEIESGVDCMTDADGDGYGNTVAPTNGVAGTDCDDSSSAANPGASEICDGIDNDCDSFADDADLGFH